MNINADSDWYRLRARHLFEEEGTLEFDDKPVVNLSQYGDGAYVQAWVWIYAPEPGEDEEVQDNA